MFELSPPLGFKDENATYQFEFTKNNQNKAHLINHKKKMVLYKKDIFKHLKSFNVMIYTNNMIHFKDVCIQIAHNAVCRKHKLDGIEISDKKVVARL